MLNESFAWMALQLSMGLSSMLHKEYDSLNYLQPHLLFLIVDDILLSKSSKHRNVEQPLYIQNS